MITRRSNETKWMNTMADNSVQHTKIILIKNVAIPMWNIIGTNKKVSELLSNLKNKKIYMLVIPEVKINGIYIVAYRLKARLYLNRSTIHCYTTAQEPGFLYHCLGDNCKRVHATTHTQTDVSCTTEVSFSLQWINRTLWQGVLYSVGERLPKEMQTQIVKS
jgi:hypothetical protein